MRAGNRADVCLSIVESVVVDVVGEEAGRDVDDEVVHVHVLSGPVFAVCEGVDGVKGVGTFVGIPFVLFQAVVIFGIDDGEFVFSEGDFSEGIAEPDASVYEKKGDAFFFEEFCDSKNNLFDFPCRLSI